ncbi:MAG: AmmeMemoRadiSam system radical SAM enzyme [Candidatus Abyssubacteria bacterium]|nr:AmmeMemoRadiSam system radical SAM enzyme [Candidatus Abyssubacteria bacterium]
MISAKRTPHRADFWKAAENSEVDCFLCSHRCHISSGKRGVCGVRENREGVFYTLVYGRLIAENADPIEKKPLYHFLPGTLSYSIATPGCNFSCGFCQNWQISQARGNLEKFPDTFVDPGEVVKGALKTKCASIAYTYTEPTIYMEYALDVARLAKEAGLKNVFVTNGYETPEAVQAMRGLIDAANIDLKSFSDEFYRSSCGGRLEPVLDSIRAMREAGIHVEVTTLLVTGQNDSAEELERIASFLAGVSPDIPWHISRFHPDYQALDNIPTPISALERAVSIGESKGIRFIYVGNVAQTDRLNTRCPKCGEVVLRRAVMTLTAENIRDGACGACGERLPIIFK